MAQAANHYRQNPQTGHSLHLGGKDKRGTRVKGKELAPDETALRADLRRQGIAPSRIRKQSQAFQSGARSSRKTRGIRPAAGNDAGSRYPMVQAFEIVAMAMTSRPCRSWSSDVKSDVEGGTSLPSRSASIRCTLMTCL